MKQIEYISYGGGSPSLALIILNIQGKVQTLTGKKLDEIIFADTGWESKITIEHIKLHKEYIQDHGYKLITVKSKLGRLDEYVTKSTLREKVAFGGIPVHKFSRNNPSKRAIMNRTCTGLFKIAPIHHYIREKYGTVKRITQLGIHAHEIHRVKDSPVKRDTNRFPLVDLGMNRQDCNNLIESVGLPLLPKSGCVGCPYVKTSTFKNMLNNGTDDFDRAVKIDETLRLGNVIDHAYLWSEMKPLKTLKENPQLQLFDQEWDNGCDSGYCFT